jgi:hypothetical protein
LFKGPTVKTILHLNLEDVYIGGTFKCTYEKKEPTGKQSLEKRSIGPFNIESIVMEPVYEKIQ